MRHAPEKANRGSDGGDRFGWRDFEHKETESIDNTTKCAAHYKSTHLLGLVLVPTPAPRHRRRALTTSSNCMCCSSSCRVNHCAAVCAIIITHNYNLVLNEHALPSLPSSACARSISMPQRTVCARDASSLFQYQHTHTHESSYLFSRGVCYCAIQYDQYVVEAFVYCSSQTDRLPDIYSVNRAEPRSERHRHTHLLRMNISQNIPKPKTEPMFLLQNTPTTMHRA